MASQTELPLVLVTAVNGFIASWTAKVFLDAGYNVRGTTRSAKSAATVLEADPFKEYAASGRFTIFQVPDITLPGAFDDAVRGVHAIAHTASPMPSNSPNPESFIGTAVDGAKSVLESAYSKAGPNLKTPTDAPYTFTEEDWDDFSEKAVELQGKEASPGLIYKASKTAAERAMWDFQREKSPSFTLAAINPVFVWGPPILFPENPEDINSTTMAIWTIFSGQDIPPPPLGRPGGGAVDVRDVARLILFAVQEPEKSSNQRFLAVSGLRVEQAIADILRQEYPDRRTIIKEGTPGVGYLPDFSYPENSSGRVDGSKAVKATGKEWISPKQSIIDAAKAFERYL
ncbi:NAD dependent epimerase/dehydratase, putative [Talaromyces stipitatus ATCC 10500]|uniref:NAD dependent epimerase/dehydratase, putative n=1 Tax=Talaromyces stipitatus (strain ATCC 10500 / CBS 375.48 / QM 6759 / NRRL 1006) TaxID=441959 RepID=B8MHY6_TALSN|nr:NAD dependent epimerase/dehydratase, putative [Talaromyces stipitatus ATCC 10500]EED16466.1 NAD dependent epimerase/dehydratase, putative [Talaromyces stipitatus ATCC 10500]